MPIKKKCAERVVDIVTAIMGLSRAALPAAAARIGQEMCHENAELISSPNRRRYVHCPTAPHRLRETAHLRRSSALPAARRGHYSSRRRRRGVLQGYG